MAIIYSMTGFASEKMQFEKSEIACELRSLNSRYLEIYTKFPNNFRELEDRAKDIIRKNVHRGKINCAITLTSQDQVLQNLQINPGTVNMYKSLFEDIRDEVGIDSPVQLSDLLQFKEIFVAAEEDDANDEMMDAICNLLLKTLNQLNETRSKEGANLKRDLEERLATIGKLVGEVGELSKGNAKTEFDKQYRRLLNMIDENKIDRNRLEMELALISDRVDISEELVRMMSHLELFQKTLDAGSPTGKKLNFILQEMHREANTMSTKNTLIEISHRVVTVKEEVERMREQVQNIE